MGSEAKRIKRMDTTALITMAIGAVMIAVGVPLFFIGRYLLSPDDKRKPRASSIKILGIVWMAVGVLIYISVFVRFVLM
jgi:hypothetical protein